MSSHDESYLNKRKYNADAISDKIAPAILQDSVNNGNTNFEETADPMVKKVKANFSTEINDHANLFEVSHHNFYFLSRRLQLACKKFRNLGLVLVWRVGV